MSIELNQNLESAPYTDTRAEDLTDQEEPVYVLVGKIISEQGEAVAHRLLIGEGASVPIAEDLLPVFEFFRTARLERQAAEWLEWAGAPSGFLKDLVRRGYLRKILARDAFRAALSLKGLRLVPDAIRGVPTDGMVSLMAIDETTGKQYVAMFISEATSVVLWNNGPGVDVPGAAKRYAKACGLKTPDAVDPVLIELPMLLEFGFAHLEQVRVPRRLKA